MPSYYNENNPYAAQWLRNLIATGRIPSGVVDDRSILDVLPGDLVGFKQCHFFAGVGGWPYALSLANWVGPVWTGSCPCQPFSVAGKQFGDLDDRHLWPEFQRLIGECNPSVVFGEQVASKAGRIWLAGVRADLEALGYAIGAADLCAASAGAPHIRQRLFWVANAESQRQQSRIAGQDSGGGVVLARPGAGGDGRYNGPTRRVVDTNESRLQGWGEQPGEHADKRSAWASSEFIQCLDGKARRVESGIHPLANGVPGRVGRLRGYGNAIVPQIAAEFIGAYMDCRTRIPLDAFSRLTAAVDVYADAF